MPRMLAWRRAALGHACQSGNMAILLTSLLFVFKILFLRKYRVNYYDYIIKWCFGIQCNLCVSLDIAHILALSHYCYEHIHEKRHSTGQPELGIK